MALAIVPYQQDNVTAQKLYCGAPKATIGQAERDGAPMPQAYKAPMQAWADLGIVSHMQGSVVQEEVKQAGVPHLKSRFQVGRCLFRFASVLIAVLENLLCYLAYLQVAPPEDSFYNKFEAHMLGYKGLDVVLLVLAILNSCYLLLFWMMIAFMKLDLYGSMSTGRLLLSLPTGGVCAMMVFFGEGTKMFPFLCAIFVMLHLLVWTGPHICPKRQKKKKGNWKAILCRVLAFLVAGWFIVFTVMFALESTDYLHDDDCAATENKAMPVRIAGVNDWQCVKWGEPHYIRRTTSPGEPVMDALCSTSFDAFNKVVNGSTGEQATSSAAHSVRCPSHCQELGLGNSVIGCQVYSATSSICSAAVQMGILTANAGGVVKVVGRAPPSGTYSRCNRNGVLSLDMQPPAATVNNPAWAFYFQVEGMESLDMVTMHSWRKTSSPKPDEPWRSYVADVTWVVGGASQRREVVLGPGGESPDIELNFCKNSASCT